MCIPRCGYLVGKIIHSSVGLGDKISCDSITFVLYSASPSPWSPFLSCSFALLSNAGPSPALSYSSSTARRPVLLPLLWVRVSLRNHLTLCCGTQPLGNVCKAESPFSLSRLITSSTCSLPAPHLGWLICPVSQPSSAYSAHSYLSPSTRTAMPQTILWQLQFAQVAPDPWFPLGILVPSSGQPGVHIHLALCLLTQ